MDSEKHNKDQSNILIKIGQNTEETSLSNRDENPDEKANSFKNFESQFNFPPRAEKLLEENNVSQQALENIKHIFTKTQTIKKVADEKHQEMQTQFQELRHRLNNSSECLQRMQKGINNLKFSYQAKILEMQHTLQPGDVFDPEKNPLQTKEDMEKHMDEIRDKIEKIQSNVSSEKEKHEKVMQSYQEAFDNVSNILEKIDQGAYSSLKIDDVNKNVRL